MMAANILPIVLLGGGALMLSSKKKKRRSSGESISFEDDMIVGGDESAVQLRDFNSVSFSLDFSNYVVGGGWKIRALDKWLNERRLQGKLLTKGSDEWSLYNIFINDPVTFIGDITGTGKVGGAIVYGGLWLMASAGIGIYWAGFAGLGTSGSAAIAASQATRAGKFFRTAAAGLQSKFTKAGYAGTKAEFAMKNAAGLGTMAAMSDEFGVREGIMLLSSGAYKAGKMAAATALAVKGIQESLAPDLAASAVEAAAIFTATHTVDVGGIDVPIALLPSGPDYPAVQSFNREIMNYIVRFQQSTFE